MLAVVEQGSFRQAAAKLDIPQSTVSRRVAQLEGRLGISIFDRDHRGVRLTSAGERFIDEAVVGAQHFTNAVGAMHATRSSKMGSLRIGMFTSLRNGFLRALVGQYRERHPDVECHFSESTTQAAVGGVLDGRLDIAFVTGRPVAPRCETTRLGDEGLFVAQQRTAASLSVGAVELSSLRDRRFIVTKGGRGPEIEDFLVARLSSPGFRPNIQVHDVSFETLLHMVELGFGDAVVSEGAMAQRTDALSFSALLGPDCRVEASAVWLTSNTNPALRPLIALAQQLRNGPYQSKA